MAAVESDENSNRAVVYTAEELKIKNTGQKGYTRDYTVRSIR